MNSHYSPENSIAIGYRLEPDGYKIILNGYGDFSVRYNQEIFKSLPLDLKQNIAENFIYSRTAPLGLASNKSLAYEFAEPALKQIADFGVRGDLPRLAYYNEIKLADLEKKFKQRQIFFDGQASGDLKSEYKSDPEKALIAMSFGKDSLLTYALAKEIGISCQLAYVNEMEGEYGIENSHKRRIIDEFSREQNEQIEYLDDNLDAIFYIKNLPLEIHEFDNANCMLAYSLELFPWAYYFGAKYLILGNEKNLDNYWLQEGRKAYPAFDQSSEYAIKLNSELEKFSKCTYQTASLVSPIYNLSEMKILGSRYPQLLKYIMSCSYDMTEADRWCNQCPTCAKTFLYAAASDIDPKLLGFKQNLFQNKDLTLFPLFNQQKRRAYEMPSQVFDEQLLSFLLAYRLGWHGAMIDLFKEKHLAEAESREKELRQEFFKIYDLALVPPQWQPKLLTILQGELGQLI